MHTPKTGVASVKVKRLHDLVEKKCAEVLQESDNAPNVEEKI